MNLDAGCVDAQHSQDNGVLIMVTGTIGAKSGAATKQVGWLPSRELLGRDWRPAPRGLSLVAAERTTIFNSYYMYILSRPKWARLGEPEAD